MLKRSGLVAILLAATFSLPAMADPSPTERQIISAAEAMRGRLVEQRRDFHMNPELSNREERTSKVVADRLRAIGFSQVQTGVARHGVVGLLKGGLPGPVVAVRADMDALPIQESIDVPYKSTKPGVKHACGHDVHTAVGLGVAEILFKMKDKLPGTVKFIFQPCEEGPPPGELGGADVMVKEGVLENPRPLAIFGLHCAPDLEAGKIGYASGPTMASSDRFQLVVRGKMSHGAWPHDGIDAMVVAAETIAAIQTIRSRRVDPLEPLVVTIGKIQGGNRFNIIADEVTMDGTFRTLDESYREKVATMIRKIAGNVAAAHEARSEFKLLDGNPVTYNNPALVEKTLPAMRRVMGNDKVIATKPVMGAEDFSYYQKVIPGFFYWLGVRNESRGIVAKLHTADFDVDEECLVVGTRVMASVLMDFLQREAAAQAP